MVLEPNARGWFFVFFLYSKMLHTRDIINQRRVKLTGDEEE